MSIQLVTHIPVLLRQCVDIFIAEVHSKRPVLSKLAIL